MEDIAHQIAEWLAAGRGVTTGRVIGIEGFSTWPGSQLVAFDDSGGQTGEVLGPPGTGQLQPVAAALRTSGGRRIVDVEIRGQDVTTAGLSCGGRAQVLMESATSAPTRLWTVLAGRAPAALLTPLDSDGAASTLVEPGGATSGPEAPADLVDLAAGAFRSGRSGVQRPVREDGTSWLVQSWVPTPRLVVVGAGDLVGAIAAQAGLLGWEMHALDRGDLAPELAWAGASAAVVVLSHDPHVDSPALQAALEAGAPYVGAMGSRATQSRRTDRLAADGVPADLLGRIHRPIGLDLGGRSAAEVALSICAEILAVRCGRDGRSLRDRSGPIHDRPAAG